MLDFLRRKERRKQPSQDNVQFSAANVVKYPNISSGSASAMPSHHQQSSAQPLRDRNPPPARQRPPSPPKPNAMNMNINLHAQSHGNLGAVHHPHQNPSPSSSAVQLPQQTALRRANTQHQPAAARRPKPAVPTALDKENTGLRAAGGMQQPALSHERSDGGIYQAAEPPQQQQQQQQQQQVRRWGKRNNTQNNIQQQQKGLQDQNVSNTQSKVDAPDGKKKRNRRFKNRHEPAVLAKAVTSDRRRSVKAPAPVAVPPLKKNVPSPAPNVPIEQSPSPAQQHLVRRPSPTRTQAPGQPKYSEVTWASWPHVDLAAVLKSGDISRADVFISRIVFMVSREDSWRTKMIQEGAATSIVTLLRHPKATLAMRQDATFAIAELAVLDTCEDALVQAGAIQLLVWFANVKKNTDIAMMASACRALRNLLTFKEETAVLIARHGVVEPLLALVGGRSSPRVTDPVVIVEAVAAVSNLLNHGSRFQTYVLSKHGGLAALISLGSTTDSEEALFHVVNILADCATSRRWHKHIADQGGIQVSLRALRIARLPDVPSEASRLIGNVAITHKARVAVRDNGGLTALIDRLIQQFPPSFTNATGSQQTGAAPLPAAFSSPTLAFDIIRALANVCHDSRAASDTLTYREAAATLLAVYTADKAPEVLVKAAFHTLHVLAQGSATRRAKVLYAVGIQVKKAAMVGMSPKRLYDLRQVILEDVETGEKDALNAMPESLERLSRASVRMINSGVVNYSRGGGGPGQFSKRGSSSTAQNSAQHVQQSGSSSSAQKHPQVSRLSGRQAQQQQHGYNNQGPAEQNGNGRRVAQIHNAGSNNGKFRSTGRVVSVTQSKAVRKDVSGMRQLADGSSRSDDPAEALPRGNEEAKASDEEIRARMLAREADGNMVQDFFEIGQVLGKGGYGSVFMAKDLRTGDIVAIKRFHQSGSMVDRKAVKEQNIWKGLHHQNVVEFRGSFVGDNGSLNLVVEFVDGLSLAEHLSQVTAFPERLVAEIARQVLCGLAYLHQNGVTHRDLKPANILVDAHSAAVKICDFGVSRSDNVQTINPGQQHMVGTPWYIAPEMVEYRPYTTSVDIWSLGCTVLELATGRRPYHELSAMQVLFRMVEDRCPPIPQHVSAEAKDFLKACWVWDPQSRPSANQLLQHPFIRKARKFSDSSKQSSGNNSTPPSTD